MNSLFPPGAQLGPYELLLPLPRTSAAQVYIARFHGVGGFRTRVAVKTIPRAYLDDLPTEHLLREQASLAAQIRNPNLVETLDLGEEDETLYVATEWVDGEPLQALLSESLGREAMPLSIAVNIAGQACRGLHAIHTFRDARGIAKGAVHGHVSPQNLLLSYNGTVKVSDFGIARAMDRMSFLTRATQQHNKLTFAAPEQLSARPVDRRSDVFSLGTLLYLLTTGRHPFEGSDVRETLNNICCAEPAEPPSSRRVGFPNELSLVIAKALRKAPDERWGSALEFLRGLERALPDCFHATAEQRLGTYLERFFAAHKIALHARIHAAEQQQDKRRSSLPAPRGTLHSSMPAVALDMGLLEASPTTQRSVIEMRPGGARASARERLRAAGPLGVAAAFVVTAGFGLWYEFASRREGAASVAPASQVEIAAVSAVPLGSPPAPKLEERALPVAASAPRPIDISELPPEPAPVAAAIQAERARPAFQPGPRRTAPASSASAAPTSTAAAPLATQHMDAWDPSTFGGRH